MDYSNICSCNSKNICHLCKYYIECKAHENEARHITLYEAASVEQLEERYNKLSAEFDDEQLSQIKQLIDRGGIMSKIDQLEIYENEEELDFIQVHPKTDVVIITKAQYDAIIKEGLALEKEVEELREKVKEYESHKEK